MPAQQPPRMAVRLGLLDLPNELLRYIKSCSPPFELTANVCYYQLSDRTAACFDGEAESDEYWKALCIANGLSVTNEDVLRSDTWRNLAYDCARHAWQCQHPECGLYRLERNRTQMESMRQLWSTDWEYPNIIKSRAEPWRCPLESNDLFEHIGFQTVNPALMEFYDIPYLRHQSQSPAQEVRPHTLLREHPIAFRSFATFPPIDGMTSYAEYIFRCKVQNNAGVTVLDVINALKTVMDIPLSMKAVRILMGSIDDPEQVFPASWDVLDRLSSLEQLRDWFKVVKLAHIYIHRIPRDFAFECAFSCRDLPERPHDLHGLSSEDL